jgi:integrase
MAGYSRRSRQPSNGGAKGDRRRSPGEGSVYPTKDGRWRGLVTWTNPDGSQGRRYVSGATQAATRAAVDDLRKELRTGPLTAPGSPVTVGDYLRGWIERSRMRIRASTWAGYETNVRCYLIPTLGRIPLAKLAPSDVEAATTSWIRDGRPILPTERKAGAKAHKPVVALTARHVRATLRTALSDAVREGLVSRNAARDSRPPYTPHRAIVYLAAPDVRRLIAATSPFEYGQAYAMAGTTGLRLGELLGLTWPDVAGGQLRVRKAMAMQHGGTYARADTKSERSRRTIPLPAAAAEALELRRARQDADKAAAGSAWQDRQGLIFTDRIGRPLRPGRVSSRFHDDIRRTDVPVVTFHDLRHSAATMLLAEGIPLEVVSNWLGHSGIAITAQHYAEIVPQLRQDAADAMDRAMRGGSE